MPRHRIGGLVARTKDGSVQRELRRHSLSRSAGILPRCLIWEADGCEGKNGCAVIGINPGQAEPEETQNYGNGATLEELWELAEKAQSWTPVLQVYP